MAAALTTYGRLLLYGNAGEYAPAAGWQGVAVFSGIPMASAPSARMKCSARWGPFRH